MGKQTCLFCQNEDSRILANLLPSRIPSSVPARCWGDLEKWLTYVLKNIKTTKLEDYYKLPPEE